MAFIQMKKRNCNIFLYSAIHCKLFLYIFTVMALIMTWKCIIIIIKITTEHTDMCASEAAQENVYLSGFDACRAALLP